MRARISKFFSPPTFADDDDKTRSAQLLHVVLLAVLGVLILYLWIGSISAAERSFHWWISGTLILLVFSLLLWMRRGYIHSTSLILVVGIWVALTAGAMVGGGVSSPAHSGYLMVVIIAGLLLGRKAAYGFAALCILSGVGLLYAGQRGMLPIPPATDLYSLSLFISQAVFLATAALLLGLAKGNTDNAYEKARRELDERRRAEASLRESEMMLKSIIAEFQQADERQRLRRSWLEKVLDSGKAVAQVTNLQDCLLKIYESVQKELSFDRVGLFMYDSQSGIVQGVWRTDQNGKIENHQGFTSSAQDDPLFQEVLSQPTHLVFKTANVTDGLSLPDGDVGSEKEQVTVAAWLGDQPIALISVDNLLTRRSISEEQLEALRLFAGYAGLAIGNARLLDQTRHGEEQLRLALNAAHMGIWQWNILENTVSWSDRTAEIYGYKPGEFPGSFEDYITSIYPEDYPLVERANAQARAGEIQDYDVTCRIVWPDTSVHWIEEKGHVYRDETGTPTHLVGTTTDITDRKLADEALQESQRFVQRIADTVPGLLYVLDLDSLNNVYTNREIANLLGYSAAEVQAMESRALKILMHPEDLKRTDLSLQRFEKAADRDILEFEYRMRAANGSWRWLHSWETIFTRHPDGRPSQLLGIAQDITERRQMEDTLRLYTERLKVLRNLDQAILTAESPRAMARVALEHLQHLVEARHTSVLVFDLARGTVDILAVRAGNKRLSRIALPDRLDDYEIDDKLKEGQIVIVENLKRLSKKSAFYRVLLSEGVYSCISVPLIVQGKLIGALNLGLDEPQKTGAEIIEIGREMAGVLAVSIQQSHLLAQIRDHAQALEIRVAERTAQLAVKANELETFAYSISHDLKAPLRGIDGYSKLLLEGYKDKLGQDGLIFLETIRWAAQQMNQLINDLLSYASLERQSVLASRVFLPDIINVVLEEIDLEIARRQVTVNNETPPITLVVSPNELTDAIRHLVDNALKFTRDTPDPRIEIGGEETLASYIVWVKDNGIGFSMKYHDRIFEVFQRLNRVEDYPGTGIGLALVHKIMQRMGGRVWANSFPGQGATFYLEIPK